MLFDVPDNSSAARAGSSIAGTAKPASNPSPSATSLAVDALSHCVNTASAECACVATRGGGGQISCAGPANSQDVPADRKGADLAAHNRRQRIAQARRSPPTATRAFGTLDDEILGRAVGVDVDNHPLLPNRGSQQLSESASGKRGRAFVAQKLHRVAAYAAAVFVHLVVLDGDDLDLMLF